MFAKKQTFVQLDAENLRYDKYHKRYGPQGGPPEAVGVIIAPPEHIAAQRGVGPDFKCRGEQDAERYEQQCRAAQQLYPSEKEQQYGCNEQYRDYDIRGYGGEEMLDGGMLAVLAQVGKQPYRAGGIVLAQYEQISIDAVFLVVTDDDTSARIAFEYAGEGQLFAVGYFEGCRAGDFATAFGWLDCVGLDRVGE